MAECPIEIPSLEKQKDIIQNYKLEKVEKGETWCLLENKWFKQWKKYVGYDSWDTSEAGIKTYHPGPIDNSAMLIDQQTDELKEHLIDELDYILLPQAAWDELVSWYGQVPDQKPILRRVIEYGMFVKHCKVEIYLSEVKLSQMNDMDKTVIVKLSKMDTLEQVEKEMRRVFNIDDNTETRLWNKYNAHSLEKLENKSLTLQEAGLFQSQVIIEKRNPDGSWSRKNKNTYSSTSNGIGENGSYTSQPSNITTRSYVSNSSSNNYEGGYIAGRAEPGLCGLSNLGNTCFMNSALQCMSNTPPLTEYFIDDKYWDELNTDNPLGMQGEIAKSYGELIKTIWSGRYTYAIPKNFKMIVGRFAPQFSGYQQQDCQELMAFLLDGLHEDLNRVKKKPYIEIKDADGRDDVEVAKEAWENYQKRNNSVIVDTFHGLLKSTLVCPDCRKISVTFDPFCYLSLPLPIKKERHMQIVFVWLDMLRRKQQMKVTVPKLGQISDLCDAVSKLTGVPSERLFVTEIYQFRFHKEFQKEESLSTIIDRDEIYIYEIPGHSLDEPPPIVVPVYTRVIGTNRKARRNNGKVYVQQLCDLPFLLPLPKEEMTYNEVYKLILKKMERFVNVPDPNDNWWNSSPKEAESYYPSMPNGADDIMETDPREDHVPLEEDSDSIGDFEDNQGNPRLFTIHSVNSFGNLNMDKLKDDGKPFTLTSKSYIAIDWHPKAKEKFYDEKEAKQVETHDSHNQRSSQKKPLFQLSECLELFTTIEKLGADDPWYCPSCKKHKQATKKFDLWSLPNVLIIHLKRFSYNRYWRDKLDTLVDFPVHGLDMARYVINPRHGPAVYDLIAVANHYGGMGGGHYTAYAKNRHSNHWYYFDDSSVSLATEDSVISKAAYVLFYMKRSPEAILFRTPSATVGAPSDNDEDEEEMEVTVSGEV